MLKWRYIWKGSAILSASLLGEITPEILKTKKAVNFKMLPRDNVKLIKPSKAKQVGIKKDVSEGI
ncbi:hypothetical protein D0907_20320 (plasmid) [Pseudoalteromonas lipolytica]|uniref:Uncharacterized protein n=1 Tax=Pseudoalteromonas lipolytica TaxID=570156 RepID=A0AAD0S5U2_9GAMM|nr:hypothetical protein D0907_20320 [Pseudoalteromonas donghaensis]